MTETQDTTEQPAQTVETGQQILGKGFSQDAYNALVQTRDDTVNQAARTHRATTNAAYEVRSEARAPRREATRDISQRLAVLFGSEWDPRTELVMQTINVLGQGSEQDADKIYRDASAAAGEVYDKAVADAEDAYNKAVEELADPFITYLLKTVSQDHSGRVQDVLRNFPCTIDELNEIADNAQWCMEYESILRRMFDAGLFTDTREEVRTVSSYMVPDDHNAQDGELWEMVVTLPASDRPSKMEEFDNRQLRRRAIGDVVYRKQDPATAKTITEDDSPF